MWNLESVGDLRQSCCVLGIDLVRNWRTKEPYHLNEQVGIRVCDKLAKKGILTRPIGNVIVIMPPYCTTKLQIKKIFSNLYNIIDELL